MRCNATSKTNEVIPEDPQIDPKKFGKVLQVAIHRRALQSSRERAQRAQQMAHENPCKGCAGIDRRPLWIHQSGAENAEVGGERIGGGSRIGRRFLLLQSRCTCLGLHPAY